MYNRSVHYQWQTHKGSRLCCCETFLKFPTCQSKKNGGISCALQRGKDFVQTSGTDRKRILRRCAIWGLNPTDVKNPK